MKLTQKMCDTFVYTENHKALMSEIKEEPNKQKDALKDVLCSCISRSSIVKTLILPKLVKRFKTLPVKTSTESSCRD